MLDAYSEAHRVETRIYADHRLAPVYQVSCDIGGKSGTLFSPDYLRREAFPRLAREIEPLKQAGIRVLPKGIVRLFVLKNPVAGSRPAAKANTALAEG